MAHPLGVKGFAYRRVKNDIRDAADLADLLRMGRLPESWIAPPEVRELRELVRYRAKLVALRSGLKAQVHAVLAKVGILITVSDLFGVEGRSRLEQTPLSGPYAQRVTSLLHLIDILDAEEDVFNQRIADRLRGHPGCRSRSSCLSGLLLVVAGPGSGLVATSPMGPEEPVGRVVDEPDDKRVEQALDLVAGERYQLVRPGMACVFVGADDSEESMGEHRESDPAVPGRPASDLVFVQSGQALA